MRQVTRNCAQAFIDGRNYSEGNTSVFVDANDVRIMSLHGNVIAEMTPGDPGINPQLRVTLAGWPTNTTRERINGLLETIGCFRRVWQEKHAQYVGQPSGDESREITAHEWIVM
jgi:hypothetical protein